MPAERPQPFVVQLPPLLAARALGLVNDSETAYGSLSDLAVVAIENQLALEEGARPGLAQVQLASSAAQRPAPESQRPSAPSGARTAKRPPAKAAPAVPEFEDLTRLIQRPSEGTMETRDYLVIDGEPLSAFTNRLAPLVIGPRVLLNLPAANEAPTIDVFATTASQVARLAGLRLRDEDVRAGRRGRYRRWTGWPVGDEEAKSLSRFRKSFLVNPDSARAVGPLVSLGLVSSEEGRVYPTPVGQEFGLEKVDAFDGGGTDLLSDRQRELLIAAVLRLEGERQEVVSFLNAMSECDGVQELVDERIAKSHPEWTEAQTVSQRAALVGRLRDLAVIDVDAEDRKRTVIIAGRLFERFMAELERSESVTKEGLPA